MHLKYKYIWNVCVYMCLLHMEKHTRFGISLFWHLSRHPKQSLEPTSLTILFPNFFSTYISSRVMQMQSDAGFVGGCARHPFAHSTLNNLRLRDRCNKRSTRHWSESMDALKRGEVRLKRKILLKRYISSYLVNIDIVCNSYISYYSMLCCCLILSRTYQRQQHLK